MILKEHIAHIDYYNWKLTRFRGVTLIKLINFELNIQENCQVIVGNANAFG